MVPPLLPERLQGGTRHPLLRVVVVLLAALVLALVALVSPLTGAAADNRDKHGRSQTIVVLPANPATFGGPTPDCPVLKAEFQLTDPTGQAVGSGRSCVQEIIPMGGTSQRVKTIFTFVLKGGKIVVDLTIDERFFDEDAPGITFQDFTGTVIRGTGAYRHAEGHVIGGGTLTFNEDATVTFDSVFVITLTPGH
jgi:hypothetical protein